MSTLTTSSAAPSTQRKAHTKTSILRRILAGAATFDAVGGAVCFALAGDLARWLSIPRTDVYVTGALFLAAAAAGGFTLRREPLRLAWIVSANELFAVWCLVMLLDAGPNSLGVALLAIATLSSAGAGAGELVMARRS